MKRYGVIGAFVALFLVAIICVVNMVTIVPVNHVGILLRAGVVQETELAEGYHVVTPFVDKVIVMSNAVETSRIIAGGKDATTTETAETLDQQLIPTFDFEVQYQLAKDRSFEVYKNYGQKYENSLIISNATACIKRVFSTYNSDEIVAHKNDIPNQVKDMLSEMVEPFGMTIVRVNMRNYDFTPEYTALLEERAMMKAKVENTKIAQQRELIEAQTAKDVAIKQAEQAAETQRIAAENERQIAMTKAQSQAEANKIKVDAEAYVVKTQAEADKAARLAAAEATKAELEAESGGLNELIIQKLFLERWNGELMPSFSGGTTFSFADMTDLINQYTGVGDE